MKGHSYTQCLIWSWQTRLHSHYLSHLIQCLSHEWDLCWIGLGLNVCLLCFTNTSLTGNEWFSEEIVTLIHLSNLVDGELVSHTCIDILCYHWSLKLRHIWNCFTSQKCDIFNCGILFTYPVSCSLLILVNTDTQGHSFCYSRTLFTQKCSSVYLGKI